MVYLFFFILEVCGLFFLERKMWGRILTPLNALMIPYVITTFVAILLPFYDRGIPSFYFPSLFVWMFGLLIFEIPSLLIAAGQRSRMRKTVVFIIPGKRDDYYWFLFSIALVCIALSLFRINSMGSQMDAFGSDEFSAEYQQRGLLAHLQVILISIVAYAIYKLDWHHLTAIIVIVGAMAGMYAVGTKSWIIAPLLIGYYARVLSGKTKPTLRNTLLPIFAIIAIFVFSYYLILFRASGMDDPQKFVTFVTNHFLNYFCSGTLTLGIDYKRGFVEPEMTEALFAPFVNVINVLTDEPHVKKINPVFLSTGVLGESNVRTFFGTIYAYGKSYFLFSTLALSFSIITNAIYLAAIKRHNIFFMLINCANLVFLTFGFFEYYWVNLSCYEIPLIYLTLYFLILIGENRSKKVKPAYLDTKL